MPLIIESHGMRAEFQEGAVKPDAETTEHHIMLENGEVTALDLAEWSARPEAISGTITIADGAESQMTFSFSDAMIQVWSGPELDGSPAAHIDELQLKAAQFGIVIA